MDDPSERRSGRLSGDPKCFQNSNFGGIPQYEHNITKQGSVCLYITLAMTLLVSGSNLEEKRNNSKIVRQASSGSRRVLNLAEICRDLIVPRQGIYMRELSSRNIFSRQRSLQKQQQSSHDTLVLRRCHKQGLLLLGLKPSYAMSSAQAVFRAFKLQGLGIRADAARAIVRVASG